MGRKNAEKEINSRRQKLKTLSELVEFSKQPPPSSPSRGLKRMPTVERLELAVGEIKNQISGGGASTDSIKDHQEALKREQASLTAETEAVKKLAEEKEIMAEEIKNLESE